MANLQEAIEIIKAGDKQTGEKLLREFLNTHPDSEATWLWLAVAESDETAKRSHLEKVLALNPANEIARNALAKLGDATTPLPTLNDLVPAASKNNRWGNAGHSWLWAVFAPFGLLIFFFLMLLLGNFDYIGRMLLPCSFRDTLLCSQPLGWLMSLFGLVLPVCGLLIIVGLDFWLSPERVAIRIAVAVVYLLFIIVPAIFIVLLGPAALVITETPGLAF